MGTLKILRSASLAEWLVFASGTVSIVIALSLTAAEPRPDREAELRFAATVILLTLSWVASVAELTSARIAVYRVAHALRIGLVLSTLPALGPEPHAALILVCALITSVCLYDAYPWNLWLGATVVLASAVIRVVASTRGWGQAAGPAVVDELSLICAGLAIAALGSQYIRRREELVEAQKDVRRLDGTVMSLSRANLQYQDFAGEAELVAMENERKRITRDIHDVVGYTLTNNIMMMEAATDMMQRNPFGVPALISAARENAQEGLASIRDSLYALRSQTVARPTGLRAIARMVSIYERATGVRVQTGFGTAAWDYDEAVDSAIFHMAQEGLMNSFRHGKAAVVTLIVSESSKDITVTVRDDGVGAAAHTEGIGMRGMRERLERLGGRFSVDTDHGGFMVRGTIPIERARSGNGHSGGR